MTGRFRTIWRSLLALGATLTLSAHPAQALGTTCTQHNNFALAVHGGAVWGRAAHKAKEAHILNQLGQARARLASGGKALDVVSDIVAAMEDSGLFNAGKGSVANRAGNVEMDASLMDGRHLRAGAVASVRALKNPILAARLVMDNTPQVMFAGPEADNHLTRLGAERVGPSYFSYAGHKFADITLPNDLVLKAPNRSSPDDRARFAGVWAGVLAGRLNHVLIVEEISAEGGTAVVALGANEGLGVPKPVTVRARARFLNAFLVVETESFRLAYRFSKSGSLDARLAHKRGGRASGVLISRPELIRPNGTVGAVALDRCGNLAAGTSTGGFGAKPPGRVGDSPIIGAGTYADNRSAAVSATGHGEYFIRHAVAHEIAARIRHGGQSLVKAAYQVVFKELKRDGGKGGIIAIDRSGEVVMLYNTDGMVRGFTTDKRSPQVATYGND